MKQLVASAFLLCLISISGPPAYACECGNKKSPRDELRKAKAVFVGDVIELKPGENGEPSHVKFKVKKYWKGVKEDFITISASGGLCGVNFNPGQEWLVYAFDDDLYTDRCRRTVMLKFAAEDLQMLGRAKELK